MVSASPLPNHIRNLYTDGTPYQSVAKLTIEINERQMEMLKKLDDLYGETVEERARYALVRFFDQEAPPFAKSGRDLEDQGIEVG